MDNELKIERLTSVVWHLGELAELLAEVVEDGASLGFLPPLGRAEAHTYWEGVLEPEVQLFIATLNDRVVGSVQVHLCSKPKAAIEPRSPSS